MPIEPLSASLNHFCLIVPLSHHRFISLIVTFPPHRFIFLIDPPPSKCSLVHLAMSSEKKEFDEKLFKKPVDEGRTDGEIAEIAEVSPATASRKRAISVRGATIGATPPRGLGPRAVGRLTPFAGPATGRPPRARAAPLPRPSSTKYFAKRDEAKNLKAKNPCLSAVWGISAPQNG